MGQIIITEMDVLLSPIHTFHYKALYSGPKPEKTDLHIQSSMKKLTVTLQERSDIIARLDGCG